MPSNNIVLKIGGSCLADENGLRQLRRIAELYPDSVMVFSAFKGMTDELIVQTRAAQENEHSSASIKKTISRFVSLLSKPGMAEAEKSLSPYYEELDQCMSVISKKGINLKLLDWAQSFGERMTIVVIAAYLKENGHIVAILDDRSFSCDDNFGNAKFLPDAAESVKQKLSVPGIKIVPGFIGRTKDGMIATLGRGGSDYTATYIASLFDSQIILFKDVDGVFSANPKIVKGAKIINELGADDLFEMAHYGSRVIYEKALYPLLNSRAEMLVKPYFDPGKPGTVVVNRDTNGIVVSGFEKVIITVIQGENGVFEVLSSLFEEFKRRDYRPLAVFETSAIVEITIISDERHRHIIEEIVESLLKRRKGVTVSHRSNAAMVSLIGCGIKGKSGIANRFFRVLSDRKVNVITLVGSASGRNLSAVIDSSEFIGAVQGIHAEFVE